MFDLARFPTFQPVELRRELDRLFDGFFAREPLANLTGLHAYPALNVWEDGEKLYLEAEVPGMDMKDLDILIQGNELTLKGRRTPLEGANLIYHRQERGAGEFTRYVMLPVEVNAERVEAVLKDGVLTVVLPKAETARARKITVKTA